VLCTACPYCLTMLQDGVLSEGGADMRVRDVAEIVAELL
jgi:Fe-S oxidoreductase